jgi:hypothetical protein
MKYIENRIKSFKTINGNSKRCNVCFSKITTICEYNTSKYYPKSKTSNDYYERTDYMNNVYLASEYLSKTFGKQVRVRMLISNFLLHKEVVSIYSICEHCYNKNEIANVDKENIYK